MNDRKPFRYGYIYGFIWHPYDSGIMNLDPKEPPKNEKPFVKTLSGFTYFYNVIEFIFSPILWPLGVYPGVFYNVQITDVKISPKGKRSLKNQEGKQTEMQPFIKRPKSVQ